MLTNKPQRPTGQNSLAVVTDLGWQLHPWFRKGHHIELTKHVRMGLLPQCKTFPGSPTQECCTHLFKTPQSQYRKLYTPEQYRTYVPDDIGKCPQQDDFCSFQTLASNLSNSNGHYEVLNLCQILNNRVQDTKRPCDSASNIKQDNDSYLLGCIRPGKLTQDWAVGLQSQTPAQVA